MHHLQLPTLRSVACLCYLSCVLQAPYTHRSSACAREAVARKCTGVSAWNRHLSTLAAEPCDGCVSGRSTQLATLVCLGLHRARVVVGLVFARTSAPRRQ